MADQATYRAMVEKIIQNGRHGAYAVASTPDLGIVTFSLDRKVWQEEFWPEPGTLVVLSHVMKKRAGWRANSGRFVRPSDEESPKQQHQKGA